MTGRNASRILGGGQGRAVRAAIAELAAPRPAAVTPDVRQIVGRTSASQFAPCPRCGAALRFDPEPMTGLLRECCDACGLRQRMRRQSAAEVRAREQAHLEAARVDLRDDGADAPIVRLPKSCARCGSPLPVPRVGVRGRRFCVDRASCLQRATGKRPRRIARAIALVAMSQRIAEVLPATRPEARSVTELCAALPDLTEAQLRRALLTMVRADVVRAAWLDERRGPTGGRPPMGYWRAA